MSLHELPDSARPRLSAKARLVRDRKTGRDMLLYPERGLALNAVSSAIVQRLDGVRTIAELAHELGELFVGASLAEVLADVRSFLAELEKRALLELGPGVPDASSPPTSRRAFAGEPHANETQAEDHPYTLIAELTYRCPLRCPYCSNPTELRGASAELPTEVWTRVFSQAAELGVLQVHMTGGEPLARRDLEELVSAARSAGLYVNLITSGIPLSRERLAGLRDRGVDHVQLSVQDVDAADADRIAGFPAFERKMEIAAWVKAEGLPLTVNVVLHRENLGRVEAIVALAERLHADRLELANTQYLGWALANRDALLPTRAEVEAAFTVAKAARSRLAGKMEMVFVTPDYHATTPRACMDGWARRYIHVTPAGLVLPCHAAHTIPGLEFESVADKPLGEIWRDAPGLRRFRGDDWLPEPCASCDRKTIDHGGCRCQAYQLTGDAAAVDPACSLAPTHGIIEAARLTASASASSASSASSVGPRRFLYRTPPRVV